MNKTKDIVLIALLSAILFIQEEVLTFLPNIQLTIFLLILYSCVLKTKKTILIILIHVLLDNLVIGSMNIVFVPFMFLGWSIIPICLNTIFRNVRSSIGLAYLAIIFALLYSWIYIIPNVLVYGVDPIAYLIADLLFEIILAISSFLTTLWLYEPCERVLRYMYK